MFDAKLDAGPLSWLLEKWGYNVVLVACGDLCLARATKVRTERAAWLTMGVGVIGWAVGNVWYTAVLWDMDPIPVPSPSDVLWIVYYPIVYVAMAMLLRARIGRFHASRLGRRRARRAGRRGALGRGRARERAPHQRRQPLDVATNLAYPLGDLVLLGMVTGGIARPGGSRAAPGARSR